MKCLICAKFCLDVICENCLDSIPLRPSVREVKGVRVYCFFAYSDIEFLLRAKYYAIGSRIYRALGKIAGEYFFETMGDEADFGKYFDEIKIVGIDDCVRSFYSHTGVLVREFAHASKKKQKKINAKSSSKKSQSQKNAQARFCNIVPIYGELKATHQISYAGKSLAFRQANKRGLILSNKISKNRACKARLDFGKFWGKNFWVESKKFFSKDFALDFVRDFGKKSANKAKAESGAIIIVDDIITTGTSFGEAIEVCQNSGVKVLFCLSLCNAAL